MITVVIPGPILVMVLIFVILVPWAFGLRYLLRKLDAIVIPWIERRYDKEDT